MGHRQSSHRSFLSRLKAGEKYGVAFGIGTFSFLTAAAGAAGVAGAQIISGTFIFSLVVGLGIGYLKGKGQILPRNLVDEAKNTDAPYTCDFCTASTLAEACDLTRPHYRDEYVSGEYAEAWRKVNPKAFVHLINSDGDLCATFGVLALSASFTDQFVKGNVTDLLLKAHDILDFEQSRRSSSLYISGVVVRDPDTHLGRKRAAAMLWVMVRYIEKLYGVRRKRTLYAIAVTAESERLMKNLGFTIACNRRNRQDKYHLYSYDMTLESWKRLKEHVRAFGDSSDVCRCSF